jgi:tRNA threonylcarbamoyladenosine biosynthesis protein TsaE
MTRQVTRSAGETFDLGRSFAALLRPGDVVALLGTLGSGKTGFAAGVCRGLGVSVHVTSPTFTLINEYPAPFGLVAHIDMYRVGSRREVAELGIEEYFNDRCVCLIEWADAILDILPPAHYRVLLRHGGEELEREVVMSGRGEIPS